MRFFAANGRRQGDFWGCTQFGKTGCRGKINVLEAELRRLGRVPLVVVDEVGYVCPPSSVFMTPRNQPPRTGLQTPTGYASRGRARFPYSVMSRVRLVGLDKCRFAYGAARCGRALLLRLP